MTLRKGQSILEYLIVFTCIIAAITIAIKVNYTSAIDANFQKSAEYLNTETKKLPASLVP